MESKGDMRHVLRTLFKSDFFKAARFKRVKSPAELITGVLKLVGTNRTPTPGMPQYHRAAKVMGQELFNPPTVEGWHTGQEWIDGGMLTERINFAVDEVGEASKPGIQALIKRLRAAGDSLTPEQFVDTCLDLAGPREPGRQDPRRPHKLRPKRRRPCFQFKRQHQWPDRRKHRPHHPDAPAHRRLTRIPVRLTCSFWQHHPAYPAERVFTKNSKLKTKNCSQKLQLSKEVKMVDHKKDPVLVDVCTGTGVQQSTRDYLDPAPPSSAPTNAAAPYHSGSSPKWRPFSKRIDIAVGNLSGH